MKTIILFLLLSLSLNASAQSGYKITGWHFETYMNNGHKDSITVAQVTFDWGRWCAIITQGDHYNDFSYVLSHGCVLTQSSATALFNTGLAYVSKHDEEKIKSSLNIKTLCNL